MDFITVLSSRSQDLIEALNLADRLMVDELGFRRGGIIDREDPEGQDPDSSENQEIPTPLSIHSVSHKLQGWHAASLDFYTDGLTVVLVLIRWRAGFLNAYIRTDLRQFRRLMEAGNLELYHSTIATLANAINATGGYGKVELDITPVGPDDIIAAIRSKQSQGTPYKVCLITAKLVSEDQVRALAGNVYTVRQLPGYWVFEGNDNE